MQRFVAVVHQHSVIQETKMARSGTLLPYLAQREIQSCCFSPQKSVLLQKKCLLQQQNCVQIVFLYFPHYGTMGLLSPLVIVKKSSPKNLSADSRPTDGRQVSPEI